MGLGINNGKWLGTWLLRFPHNMVALRNIVYYGLWIDKMLRLRLLWLWIWILGFPHNRFALWNRVRLYGLHWLHWLHWLLHQWHLRLYGLAYRSAIHIELWCSNNSTSHKELVKPLTVLKSPVAHHFIACIVKQANKVNLVVCSTIVLLHKKYLLILCASSLNRELSNLIRAVA